MVETEKGKKLCLCNTPAENSAEWSPCLKSANLRTSGTCCLVNNGTEPQDIYLLQDNKLLNNIPFNLHFIRPISVLRTNK